MDDCILALAYVVMALALNPMWASPAYSTGYVGPSTRSGRIVRGLVGVRLLFVESILRRASTSARVRRRCRHPLNFIICHGAIIVRAVAGAIIVADAAVARRLHRDRDAGVRGDHRPFQNGDEITFSATTGSSNGASRSHRSAIDSSRSWRPLRPVHPTSACTTGRLLIPVVLFVNFRLRDSKLGGVDRAARGRGGGGGVGAYRSRKDQAPRPMRPAAHWGHLGAFPGGYFSSVNADAFQFGFSITSGCASAAWRIWGVVIGAILLSFVM